MGDPVVVSEASKSPPGEQGHEGGWNWAAAAVCLKSEENLGRVLCWCVWVWV